MDNQARKTFFMYYRPSILGSEKPQIIEYGLSKSIITYNDV